MTAEMLYARWCLMLREASPTDLNADFKLLNYECPEPECPEAASYPDIVRRSPLSAYTPRCERHNMGMSYVSFTPLFTPGDRDAPPAWAFLSEVERKAWELFADGVNFWPGERDALYMTNEELANEIEAIDHASDFGPINGPRRDALDAEHERRLRLARYEGACDCGEAIRAVLDKTPGGIAPPHQMVLHQCANGDVRNVTLTYAGSNGHGPRGS